jgi:cysteine protease ATG4
MAAVDFSRYKRIVQYLWDPEPTNLESSDLPLWCLGSQYTGPSMLENPSIPGDINLHSQDSPRETGPEKQIASEQSIQAVTPESVTEGVGSGFAHNGMTANIEDGGWPVAFLDDFESKLRFSYRTGFPVIPRSQDPRASSSMSFSVRLRSQLSDQGGFASDTGWGCMIRSGQSLLANSVVILQLSRGTYSFNITGHS